MTRRVSLAALVLLLVLFPHSVEAQDEAGLRTRIQEELFTFGRNHAPDTQVGSPHRIIPYRTSYRLLQGAHRALLASATVGFHGNVEH